MPDCTGTNFTNTNYTKDAALQSRKISTIIPAFYFPQIKSTICSWPGLFDAELTNEFSITKPIVAGFDYKSRFEQLSLINMRNQAYLPDYNRLVHLRRYSLRRMQQA